MSKPEFEELDYLINGYFHQDRDISGDTIEAIVGVYLRENDAAVWAGLHVDIQRFVAKYDDDQQLTDAFMRTFQPDLIERPWDMTIRQFLLRIDQLIKQPSAISEPELSTK